MKKDLKKVKAIIINVMLVFAAISMIAAWAFWSMSCVYAACGLFVLALLIDEFEWAKSERAMKYRATSREIRNYPDLLCKEDLEG